MECEATCEADTQAEQTVSCECAVASVKGASEQIAVKLCSPWPPASCSPQRLVHTVPPSPPVSAPRRH